MVLTVPILDDLRKLVRDDVRPDVEIAKAAKMSQPTFSAFMTGKRGVSVKTAERLAKVLGCPLKLDQPRKPAK